jgi:uncharacterized protein (TIGR02646 family)
MRSIIKGKEPRSLVEHRAAAPSTYEGYTKKDELRAALVAEQRGLCCYCMSRIGRTSDVMKIAHWRSQTVYPDQQLTYRNLLGACLGNKGKPRKQQHCDTRQGNEDLKFNPADPTHHGKLSIRFQSDGTIASGDDDFNKELNEVLNLNLPLLKNCRKEVLTAILEWWRSEKVRLKGSVPKKQLTRERDRRAGASGGEIEPFAPVAVWWLDQHLVGRKK